MHFNPNDSILFNLSYLSKIMNRKANTLFRSGGVKLRIEQLPVLMAIHFNGMMTQQELADMVDRDKSSVQRTVTHLKQVQLLAVRGDAVDRRKNIVSLTPLGRELTLLMEDEIAVIEHSLFSHLSITDKRHLIGIIEKLHTSCKEG